MHLTLFSKYHFQHVGCLLIVLRHTVGVGVQQSGCLSVTHPIHHRSQIQITRNHNACVGMPQAVDANMRQLILVGSVVAVNKHLFAK